MPRLKESTEYVRRNFTVEERLQMADRLAAAHNQLADIKKDQEVVNNQFKEKKSTIEQTVTQMSRNLATGFEMANVKCRIEYDKPNVNEVQYVRVDTGEVVKHRAMLPDEMQQELPLEESIDQSQANVENFFGPGRIQEPTAENAAPIPETTAIDREQTPAQAVEEWPAEQPPTPAEETQARGEVPAGWPEVEPDPAAEAVPPAAPEHQPEMPPSVASQNEGRRGRKKNGPAELRAEHEQQVAEQTKESMKDAPKSSVDNW